MSDSVYLRRPEALVHRWYSRQKAYLGDLTTVFDVPVWLYIQTNSPEGNADLEVTHFGDPANHRRLIEWSVVDRLGNNEDLARLIGRAVNIASTPRPGKNNNGRVVRPYTDILFRGGELDLTLPASGGSETVPQTFSVGRLVGLTITTPDQDYTVW